MLREKERLSARITELVPLGDLPGLCEALVGFVGFRGISAVDSRTQQALGGLEPSLRLPLARLLAEHAGTIHPAAREKLAELIARLSDRGGPADPELAAVQLTAAAQLFLFHRPEWPVEWAARIADAGGEPGPDEIALVRRHQEVKYVRSTRSRLFVHYDTPLLNEGEAWSDRATAELAAWGEPWRALVRHALTATAVTPSARWDRVATGLLSAVAADPVTERLATWFDLVRERRTRDLFLLAPYDHLGIPPYDTWNVRAVRGLLWMASLLPADARLVNAVANVVPPALTKVAPGEYRSLPVAKAAVFALSRIDEPTVAARLRDLSAVVVQPTVLKQIDAALAAGPVGTATSAP